MLQLSCISKFCGQRFLKLPEIGLCHTVRVNVWVKDELLVLAKIVRFQVACGTNGFVLVIYNRVQVRVVLFDSSVLQHVVHSAI